MLHETFPCQSCLNVLPRTHEFKTPAPVSADWRFTQTSKRSVSNCFLLFKAEQLIPTSSRRKLLNVSELTKISRFWSFTQGSQISPQIFRVCAKQNPRSVLVVKLYLICAEEHNNTRGHETSLGPTWSTRVKSMVVSILPDRKAHVVPVERPFIWYVVVRPSPVFRRISVNSPMRFPRFTYLSAFNQPLWPKVDLRFDKVLTFALSRHFRPILQDRSLAIYVMVVATLFICESLTLVPPANCALVGRSILRQMKHQVFRYSTKFLSCGFTLTYS